MPEDHRNMWRIGTRGSALAQAQTRWFMQRLNQLSGIPPVEIVTITTEGDTSKESLSQLGGTGVFATALRTALRKGEITLAVHSLKDLPTAPAPGLELVVIPVREDPRDALCSGGEKGPTLAELPEGAAIGTGSPRRAAQLQAIRPDLKIVDIRGNVGTRLARVAQDLDAVVLAAAGLHRLGKTAEISQYLEAELMLPAPGQGALAIEIAHDALPEAALTQLRSLDDADTRHAVTAERALLARLEAGCSAPVGALARRQGSMLRLEAGVFARNSRENFSSQSGSNTQSGNTAQITGTAQPSLRMAKATDAMTTLAATRLGIELAETMLEAGAGSLL